MKKLKQLACLMIAIIMLVSALASCEEITGTTTESSDASTNDTTTSSNADGFPLAKENWDGQVIRILTHGEKSSTAFEYGYDSSSTDIIPPSDILNDAFLERQRLIEETYGLKVKIIYNDTLDGPVKEIEKENLSGDSNYDLLATGLKHIAVGTNKNLYTNINEIENNYLNLDAPYYDQAALNSTSILNQLYFLTGDFMVSDNNATWAILYNKSIVEEKHLENPYELVKSGNWTLDKLHQMSTAAVEKHSSGEEMSYNPDDNDVFGMVLQMYDTLTFVWGCEQMLIGKDSDDVPYIRVDEPKNHLVWDKVTELLYDSEAIGLADYYGAWDSGVYEHRKQIFANGNALFMPDSIAVIEEEVIKEASIHYGILPMAKLNTDQVNYSSSISSYSATFLAIPATNTENLDATCYFIEAMSYYGRELVTPEYYERTLKLKKFTDDDSGEMLDIIFENRCFDIGAMYSIGEIIQFYNYAAFPKSKHLESVIDAHIGNFESELEDLIEFYQENAV